MNENTTPVTYVPQRTSHPLRWIVLVGILVMGGTAWYFASQNAAPKQEPTSETQDTAAFNRAIDALREANEAYGQALAVASPQLRALVAKQQARDNRFADAQKAGLDACVNSVNRIASDIAVTFACPSDRDYVTPKLNGYRLRGTIVDFLNGFMQEYRKEQAKSADAPKASAAVL